MRSFLFLACCFLWASCSRDDQLPKKVLPVDKMSRIMLDLQIAKSYNYSYSPGDNDSLSYPNDRKERLKMFYQQIFLLHHTDTARFFRSFRFYSTHPDWLKKVYAHMQDSLEQKQRRQQAILDARRKLEEKRRQAAKGPHFPLQETLKTWHKFTDSLNHHSSAPPEFLISSDL